MSLSFPKTLRGGWSVFRARVRSYERAIGGVERADRARRESDWAQAALGYEKYLRWAPRDLGVRIRLIKTLYSAGRLDEAEALAKSAMDRRPDKTELRLLLANIESARQASIPAGEYDRFRRGLVVPAAPPLDESQDHQAVIALVDGRGRSGAALRLTLESLRGSRAPVGEILVLDPQGQADAMEDLKGWSRSRTIEPIVGRLKRAERVVLLDAGVTLDREALGWLRYAAQATGAVAAYGDDDRQCATGAMVSWSDPAFYPAPHPVDLVATPRVPAAVLLDPSRFDPLDLLDRRKSLLAAFEQGPLAHVPLLLATSGGEQTSIVMNEAVVAKTDERILVIIPTRDEGAALKVMIDGLIAQAADLSRLDFVIVDNGSRESQTLAFLASLAHDKRARVLRVDEPFNWSRLNNLAAAAASAEILLFANNDMKMVTPHWDDLLRSGLAIPGVGVVGARMTYPNGRIQHAGIALGVMDGRPVHEGLGAAQSDEGPLRRWVRNRPAAAVTGAFLGVRREVFEGVGGFNADEFAIGCNDIDFCLRARALGWTILYMASLELIHWESRSRGHDDTEPKMRRAQAELAALERIWGQAAHHDPCRNPHWVSHETLLLYGLRQPEEGVIKAWIVDSAFQGPSALRAVQAAARTPSSR